MEVVVPVVLVVVLVGHVVHELCAVVSLNIPMGQATQDCILLL